MTRWHRLDSTEHPAPRDGTPVDLWKVTRKARDFSQSEGERVVNARWTEPTRHPNWDPFKTQPPATWCYWEDLHWEPVERESGGEAVVVTHWMPLPPPPKDEG